ncbi:MAG: DUF1569 domain-containing protein [Bacteroidota bacterium]
MPNNQLVHVILLSTDALVLLGLVLFPSFDGPEGDFLKNEFLELEAYIPYRDQIRPEISKVDVAWHVDHSLRTINEVYKAMSQSNPEAYQSRIHIGRSLLILMDRIPRGRAEAPEIVRPPEIIHTDSLHLMLALAQENLVRLDSLPEKAFFEHPYLGQLRRKTAKRFLEIHTNHHLKIIADILAK